MGLYIVPYTGSYTELYTESYTESTDIEHIGAEP